MFMKNTEYMKQLIKGFATDNILASI